ncbi:hypothetical protein J0E88_07855 [Campylobacter coli]
MFVAYLVFEIVNYLNFGIKLSVAVGGFAAYMGTDALLKIEQLVEKLINKKWKNYNERTWHHLQH